MTNSRTRPALFSKSGLTLIEIMIALTMTLIILGAMMSAFQFASQQMQMGRAVMEMANRMRSSEELLRSDLANVTVDPRPYAETAAPKGYFEYVEGPRRDKNYDSTTYTSIANDPNNYLGDVDDIIGMTVRSSGQLFRGRSDDLAGNVAVIESPLAEIVWFTTFNDLEGDGIVSITDSVRVHRRVLVIRPDYGVLLQNVNATAVNTFLASNDISCRVVSANAADSIFNVVANSLVDLSVRKNRFCHIPDFFDSHNFPNQFDRNLLNNRRISTGEDIMLTDVAGFDVKVYSPDATVNIDFDLSIVVNPGDAGYDPTAVNHAMGAYVDLDHDGGGWFSGPASFKSKCNYLGAFGIENAYDVWTPFYESDGIDQDFGNDTSGLVDQGTNGLNDVVAGGTAAPDDNAERETTPPYPFPIRGIKVSFRLIEKGTKQIHQSSVVQSYVPE